MTDEQKQKPKSPLECERAVEHLGLRHCAIMDDHAVEFFEVRHYVGGVISEVEYGCSFPPGDVKPCGPLSGVRGSTFCEQRLARRKVESCLSIGWEFRWYGVNDELPEYMEWVE